MEILWHDTRHALRRLAASPGFTGVALLTLGLGIGLNTAMFSVVQAVLLRPLPYPEADRIVAVSEVRPDPSMARGFVTNRSLPALQDEAAAFEQVAGYVVRALTWVGDDGAVTLRAAAVSPELFPLLRTGPEIGRLFDADEDREGAHRVALLSHRSWMTRFAADPAIVGSAIELDGESYRVVGVLPATFYFPSPDEEIWIPLLVPPFLSDDGGRRQMIMAFSGIGRLRPGVSPDAAAAESRTIVGRLDSLGGAPRMRGAPTASDVAVTPLLDDLVRDYRPALVVLAAATGLVLLVAAINLAGLLLARGLARRRELAVRAALGAARGRLARQLLTEGLVLGVIGGAAGLATTGWLLRLAPAVAPDRVPRLGDVAVDGTVLAFGLGLTLLVGLLFSVGPALDAARLDVARTLSEGSTQSVGAGGRRTHRARAGLALAQVAIALILLVGAGLLLRSFVALVSIDPGYDPSNVLTARIRYPELGSGAGLARLDPERLAARNAAVQRFSEALLERAERVPGVESVGLSAALPLVPGVAIMTLGVAGRPDPVDPRQAPRARIQMASPGYFDALRLRLRDGRLFTPRDTAGSPPVLVVNETLARELFDGAAVGERLLFGGDGIAWEIVGVVGDVRYEGLDGAATMAEIYVSTHQGAGGPITLLTAPIVTVRTVGDPIAVLPFLHAAVAEVAPRASLDDVMTMEARLAATVAQPRFYAAFVGLFAAMALALAASGLYGVTAYAVSQRTREIGLRLALGAGRRDILSLVVGQGAALVAGGLGLGLLGAAATTRTLASLLVGVEPTDWPTFLAGPIVLGAVGLAACYLPARRAARLDPMDALRRE